MSWQTAAHGILTTPAIHDDASLQEPARILFLGDKADKADKVSSALSPPRNTHLLTCATGLRSVMLDSKRRQVPLPPVAFQLVDEIINLLKGQASVNETFPYRPEISPIAE